MNRLNAELAEFKKLGYTPEELKLCFNTPDYIWVIEDDEVIKLYPVDGEQIDFYSGFVYWNCRDVEYGDYHEVQFAGLHKEYFLTESEAQYAFERLESEQNE